MYCEFLIYWTGKDKRKAYIRIKENKPKQTDKTNWYFEDITTYALPITGQNDFMDSLLQEVSSGAAGS